MNAPRSQPDEVVGLANARRIVVRGVNWLGDAVMTTPALLRLRERFPEAHIALLTPEKIAAVWIGHPAVNEVVTLGAGENPWSVAQKLRQGNFDLALVLPNSPRSALEVWLAGIPRRVGVRAAWRNWFLTDAVPHRPDRVIMRKRSHCEIKRIIATETGGAAPLDQRGGTAHQMHDYLHLTAAVGARAEPLAPVLSVSEVEQKAAVHRFGFSSGTLIAMNPAAQYGPAKRWPAERFIATAIEIGRRMPCEWLITGGAADEALANSIAEGIRQKNGPPCHVLAGKASLRESMALLKSCRALLTNDSGPMHMAAALGVPVVAIFGSTSPELTGPGLAGDSRHQVLRVPVPCAPCFLRECPIDFRCMTSITVEQVTAAVERAGTRPIFHQPRTR